MLLFRDEEHIDRWTRAWGLERGAVLTPEQGWRLARAWYGGKLGPDWRRATAEETEALLADIGLTGEFWRLR